MKLTILILTLVVSCMATAHVDYDEETELHSFIESLLQSAKQQQTGDSSCSCLTGFDIFAQTSGVTYAESPGGTHDVEILLANGEKKTLELTEFPPKNAAKLFSFDLPDNTQCVSIFDIAKITVVAKSTEGWNIETIVTIFADNKGRTYSGSIDRKVNRWVDHNDKPEYESFVLNLSSHG